MLALGLASFWPTPVAGGDEIIVASGLGPSVSVYPRTADGNEPAHRLLAGPGTGLSAPVSLAFDPVHDEIIMANATNQTVTAHPRTAGGDVAPLRVLGGAGSGLVGPVSAAVDPFRDELVVVSGFGQSIAVYPRTASGTAAPLRTLAGPSTGLAGPYAVALDLVHDEMVVTNITSQSVTVHARAAAGDVPALRTLVGPGTGLAGPRGVAVDPVHDEIIVANIASNAVTVYARGADGDTAPLRTLAGPSTGLFLPVSVALDLAHDELIVVGGGSVRTFTRLATGDTAPLRTIAGPDTALIAPTAGLAVANRYLVAAILPSSRSVQVGTPATAFATIINAGNLPAAACGPAPITPAPASFFFQTTEPVGNTPIGPPNTPANVQVGVPQTYVIALTPSAALDPVEVQFGFVCEGSARAPITPGVNTLLLVASVAPVPDIVAQSATIGNTGIVDLTVPDQAGAFAVATSNVGAPGTITVTVDTGGIALPAALYVCRTDPASGECQAPPDASVTLDVPAGGTPTFGIFAFATGPISFDPAVNRVFVRFSEDGVTRGATSVAIRTL